MEEESDMMRVLFGIVFSALMATRAIAFVECARVDIILPVKADEVMRVVQVDVDHATASGKRAFARSLAPRDIAACNGYSYASRRAVLQHRFFQAYDPGEFYYANNGNTLSFVGVRLSRGVIIGGPALAAPDGSAMLSIKLPMRKPLFLGFSVCHYDMRTWSSHAIVWDGKSDAIVRFGGASATEQDAYREGGKCHHFSEWR